MTRRSKLDELAEYYDTHDASGELERARYEPAEPASEAMVTYALRLPKPVLDQLRRAAERRGVRVTVLMRQWLEERLGREQAGASEAVVSVGDLLAFVTENQQTVKT